MLNGHENIISLKAIVEANNLKDLYLIFEYIESDLHYLIRSKILTENHI